MKVVFAAEPFVQTYNISVGAVELTFLLPLIQTEAVNTICQGLISLPVITPLKRMHLTLLESLITVLM